MSARTTPFALLAVLLLAAPSAMAASEVDDKAFDSQADAISEGMQLQEDAGLFGRPGTLPGEGPRASSVGDRDLDRYVERLGIEIRMRNAIADRDPEGFH